MNTAYLMLHNCTRLCACVCVCVCVCGGGWVGAYVRSRAVAQ